MRSLIEKRDNATERNFSGPRNRYKFKRPRNAADPLTHVWWGFLQHKSKPFRGAEDLTLIGFTPPFYSLGERLLLSEIDVKTP